MSLMDNDKFLYFQLTRTDAANSAVMYHIDNFLGFDCSSSDGTIQIVNMRFFPMKRSLRVNQEDAGDVNDETDLITLTVNPGTQGSVIRNITDKLNEPVPRTGRFMVIADLENSDFIDPDIIGLSITVRTASSG